MSDAKLLQQNFRPRKDRDRSSAIELWHVSDVEGWNNNNTGEKVFSRIPYEVGVSVHPDTELGGAICRSMVPERMWTTKDPTTTKVFFHAIVSVHFDAGGRSTFNPRGRSIRYFNDSITLPCWSSLGNGVTQLGGPQIDRTRIRKVVTRYARTAQVTPGLERRMFDKCGHVFRVDSTLSPGGIGDDDTSIPYLFKGPNLDDMPGGLTRIMYVFETLCPIMEIGASSVPGIDLAIPGLNYLDFWVTPRGGTAVPVEVGVVRWQDLYPFSPNDLPYLT